MTIKKQTDAKPGLSQPPPVNVAYEVPPNPPDNWEEQAQVWREINQTGYLYKGQIIIGHGGFYPLTIKAAYVIGIIYNTCNAIVNLLSDGTNQAKFYMLAYGLFASNADLLGRCLQGNNTPNTRAKGAKESDIHIGFKWLKTPSYPEFLDEKPEDEIIPGYSIKALVQLRHFAAHGRATAKSKPQSVDYTLLKKLTPKLVAGLEAYWAALGPSALPQTSEYMCNKLAHAEIATFQNWAVFDSWIEFQKKGSITATFEAFTTLITSRLS